MQTVEIPDELVKRLRQSRLEGRSVDDQVRVAVAIHLFQEEMVSIGKAAELAGIPRLDFERMLVQLGIPVVRYDLEDLEKDERALKQYRSRQSR